MNKGIQNGKEELKLSMSTGKMIIYIEKPNNSAHQHKLLEPRSKSSKVDGYKISICNYIPVD